MFPDVSCTIADMDKRDWERLGDEVVRRRVHLGMKTREALADATRLSSRVLSDIEKGRRTSYGPGTLITVERALRWLPGSIERVLGGDQPLAHEDEEIPAEGGVYFTAETASRLEEGEVSVRFTSLSDLSRSAHKLNRALIREAAGDAYRLEVADRVGEIAEKASRLTRVGISQLVDPDTFKTITDTEGATHESQSETTQESLPEDAREDGDPRTTTTGAARRGDRKLSALPGGKQGDSVDGRLPAPDPADFLAAQTIDPKDASLRPANRDEESQDHGYDDPV
jgi:hypothetical protein